MDRAGTDHSQRQRYTWSRHTSENTGHDMVKVRQARIHSVWARAGSGTSQSGAGSAEATLPARTRDGRGQQEGGQAGPWKAELRGP